MLDIQHLTKTYGEKKAVDLSLIHISSLAVWGRVRIYLCHDKITAKTKPP